VDASIVALRRAPTPAADGAARCVSRSRHRGVADLIAEVLHPYRFCSADADVQVREADFRDPFALLRLGEVDALVTLLPTTEPEPRDRSSSPSRWCWPCRYGIRSPGSTP
jgi:hypothetical protein